jgi:hypothetical protein
MCRAGDAPLERTFSEFLTRIANRKRSLEFELARHAGPKPPEFGGELSWWYTNVKSAKPETLISLRIGSLPI